MDPLAVVATGSLIGLATGLLPGLHVNTLAAVALLVVPIDGTIALGLVAVGTVHTIVNILPATYLGAADQDAAIAVLPAHRMLREGAGPTAIRISVGASLLAVIAAVLMVLPMKWLLGEPVRALPFIQGATPWVLAAALAILLWQERRKGAASVLWAAATMALAGTLGLVAWNWPTNNPWGIVASPLLPMLSGLFAVPGLLLAMENRHDVPLQDPAQPTRRLTAPALRGIGAAGVTSVMPGLTAATATALAAVREDDPRPVIATLSAVNTAHACLSILMLWLIGSTRSGLGSAIRPAISVTTWHGSLPPSLVPVLTALVLAGILGAAATLWLEPAFRWVIVRVPSRTLHMAVLVGLGAGVAALTGPSGFALFVVAAAIGKVPLEAGVRRVHLAACLIIPILFA